MNGRLEMRVDPGLAAGIRVAVVEAAPVAVGPSGPALLAEMEAIRAALATEHAGRAPGEIPGLAPARELYRRFHIDPTRTRPSSEALLRRVLQDKPLPRILNAVDLCNLLSLRFLLPLGLYDTGRIAGTTVTLRRGGPGESYPGIRKESVNVEGRPVLCDAEGPFGNPTSDSLRTSVTEAARSLWLVIFAPSDIPRETLSAHAASAAAAMARHLAGPEGPAATRIEIHP